MSDAERAPAVTADAVMADAVMADAVTTDGRATEAGAADPVTAAAGATGEVTVHRSRSPSRAADFMTCPLLYRFRVVDRLPEPPSPAAARGTLVHAVLERLFDEPAA
ncbi:MAG: PD-(D/E)XK nuclease family protein, partial [Streptosporangiaceae bacterium]